jgi:membrane-bound lytic murein transglycosylase B
MSIIRAGLALAFLPLLVLPAACVRVAPAAAPPAVQAAAPAAPAAPAATAATATPATPAATAAPAAPPVDVGVEGPFDLGRPDIQAFIDGVVKKHGFSREQVVGWLSQGVRQPRIIEAITRPAERVLPWWQYRANFLTERRIAEGAQFWAQHRERLDRIEAQTGVSAAHIVAIIGVETFYGRITGRWRVLDALMTLGFDYPPRQTFFRSELEQFLLLAREEQIDLASALGSYAGAMGAPQFMPSSYRRYAIDGGADTRRNLFTDWDDVIASVANYLKEHGWEPNQPVLLDAAHPDQQLMATLNPRNLDLNDTLAGLRGRGVTFATTLPPATRAILVPAELEDRPSVRIGLRNFHVITRYNRSIRYAMAVHDLAELVRERANATMGAQPAPAAGS